MENKKDFKFGVGDWIKIVSGEHRGKTFTITNTNQHGCCGFYCGKAIMVDWKDVEAY